MYLVTIKEERTLKYVNEYGNVDELTAVTDFNVSIESRECVFGHIKRHSRDPKNILILTKQLDDTNEIEIIDRPYTYTDYWKCIKVIKIS